MARWDELNGQRVAFYLESGRRKRSPLTGYRTGRVVSVDQAAGELRSVVVRLVGPAQTPPSGVRRRRRRVKYQGPRLRVYRSELESRAGECGVVFRRKVTPLEEWLERRAARC